MQKNRVLSVHLSAAEYQKIAGAASAARMSSSAFLRLLALGGVEQKRIETMPASSAGKPEKTDELMQRLAEQEAAFLQVVETIRASQRRPYFGEWRLRRGVELGPAPGATQFDKLLWLARDYHSVWGAWPKPNDPGFGSLPTGVDPSAWPNSPPPSAA